MVDGGAIEVIWRDTWAMVVVLADDVNAMQNTVKHDDAYNHCAHPEATQIYYPLYTAILYSIYGPLYHITSLEM